MAPLVGLMHIHRPSIHRIGSNEPLSKQRMEYCGYFESINSFTVAAMREQSEIFGIKYATQRISLFSNNILLIKNKNCV